MRISNLKYVLGVCAFSLLISCNDKSNVGNTTSEGTTLEDQRPNQNEASMSGNVDTITSPGSNATDLDPNMQNQSDTHGTNTQSGDNGTGAERPAGY